MRSTMYNPYLGKGGLTKNLVIPQAAIVKDLAGGKMNIVNQKNLDNSIMIMT